MRTKAGKMEPVKEDLPESAAEAQAAEGKNKSSKKNEDLVTMVKKLQEDTENNTFLEGSLEPQIKELINRINELQQAKKKSTDELGETRALWEALHKELDSLSGEKAHLEEVLSKKQEALRILQLHGQRKKNEAQRENTMQEETSAHNSEVPESHRQRKLGLNVEELEHLIGQHKDLWEFHILKHRLAWEIHTLQGSREQLLAEENEARAKLREVERRLRAFREAPAAPREAPAAPREVPAEPRKGPSVPSWKDGMKAELDKFEGQVLAQTLGAAEGRAGERKLPQADPDLPGAGAGAKDKEALPPTLPKA
ncbi:PREDICTED: synaptonemal complex central element protein 1-like isoform X2 [Condylura cristata]|uniref:synaptonemal complex central element protein 1-like isoform X2 n=1 Tax=Condylura cristata TaxID=143302 RepID=UPI0006432FC1|nr:PREDICTED: synaptonemal complex central element protein 1-like isoform X2 [Condylura cristata]